MPRWVVPALLLLVSLATIPFACVARARVVRSPLPRVHLVPDMDSQGKFKTQQANPLFADTRSMRPPVEGTVARGQLRLDDHFEHGIVDGQYVSEFPATLIAATMDRGRERYGIYCAPCHGLSGYGDGIVARRADRLQQGTWVPPASLHAEPALTRPVGHLFNSITNGIRTMPAYGRQIPAQDRWAIVAYVRALQRSQRASVEDLDPQQRGTVR